LCALADGRASVQRLVRRRAGLPGHLRERGQATEHDQPVLLRVEPGRVRRRRALWEARRAYRQQGQAGEADRRRIAAAAAGRTQRRDRPQEPQGRPRRVRQPAARAEAGRGADREVERVVKAYEVREAIGLGGLGLNPNRPKPEPAHDQGLIPTRATPMNYRDQGVIKGAYGYTKFPVIPMCDAAGEVVATGAGVTQFKVGDRVASNFFQTWTGGQIPAAASKNSLGGQLDGVLAEYVALSQDGVIRIPDHLSFEEAATLPCAALTAWNALLETGGLKAGETVAILGTGGVSCFGVMFAKLHGAKVLLTSSSDAKLERGKALGADILINYRSMPDWDKEH